MRLGETWGSLRGPLQTFTFADIKQIVGAAGLPVHELGGLQQRSGGGASKGQLLDAIDILFGRKNPDGVRAVNLRLGKGVIRNETILFDVAEIFFDCSEDPWRSE